MSFSRRSAEKIRRKFVGGVCITVFLPGASNYYLFEFRHTNKICIKGVSVGECHYRCSSSVSRASDDSNVTLAPRHDRYIAAAHMGHCRVPNVQLGQRQDWRRWRICTEHSLQSLSKGASLRTNGYWRRVQIELRRLMDTSARLRRQRSLELLGCRCFGN